jgi:hypothetical protein
MTVMAAGGQPTQRHKVLQPRADYRCAELMDRDLLSLPFAASRHPSSSTMPAQRGDCDAVGIRLAVRPMDARPRHPTASPFTEDERQQADHSPHAKGQPRQGNNERQTRGRMFEDCGAASHGGGTLLCVASRCPSRGSNFFDCVTQTLSGANGATHERG